MSAFDMYVGAAPTSVEIDCYTNAYRVSGRVATRFSRIADIVNQLNSTHLVVTQATVSEYAAPSWTLGAAQVLVALDQILFIVARGVGLESRPEMRIPKRPVRAQLALPPFRLTGSVHVTQGSRPADGLVNASDRFLSMTDVAITCAVHEGLDRNVEALAVQRAQAHVLLVGDDERPDELLADVLDEATAQTWFRRRDREDYRPAGEEPPGGAEDDLADPEAGGET